MLLVCCHHKFSLYVLIGALLLCLTGVGQVYAGDPFGFSSNWNYRKNGGGADGNSQFVENYNLTYSKELSAALGFSGSVRYNENHPSEGADSSSLNPSLSFDLRNDLFSLNLNASESKNSSDDRPTRIDDHWGLNLNSQIENWPSLRFYFNQSVSTDDAAPPQSDSDSTSLGGSIEYSLPLFDLLYDARKSKSNDYIENSETETLDQTAQISYGQSFFDGRVSIAASQQYQSTEYTSSGQVIQLQTFGRFYVIDDNPVDAPLGTESFRGQQVLTTTLIDPQNMTIEIRGQSCDLLEVSLYRETISGERVPLTVEQKIQISGAAAWTVYYKRISDLTWQPVAVPVGSRTIEDVGDRTIVRLDTPEILGAQYVKVVADLGTYSWPAFVDDIAGFDTAADIDNFNRKTENIQTQFSSTVLIHHNWSLSYSLRRSETIQATGDTLQFSHSLNSSYNPSDRLGFALGVSENTNEADNSPGRSSRSYSVSMSALPLTTLNFSLGYTRTESESDDGQDTISDSISSSLNATIYPDLTANLSSHWSQNEDLAAGTKRNNYGMTLNATAYFTPQVDLNTDLSYSESDSSSGETTRSTNYGFTLGYRPSDMLLLNFSYDADVESGNSSLSGNSSWLWSQKLQSQFGFSYDFNDETSQQYNALLSWQISRSLSFQTSGNYQLTEEEDSWSANATLNLIF